MSDGWPRMFNADRAALRSPASPSMISTAILFTSRLGQVSLRAPSLVTFKYCDGKRASADNRSMQATRKKEARETMAVWRRSGSRRTTFKSSNDCQRDIENMCEKFKKQYSYLFLFVFQNGETEQRMRFLTKSWLRTLSDGSRRNMLNPDMRFMISSLVTCSLSIKSMAIFNVTAEPTVDIWWK